MSNEELFAQMAQAIIDGDPEGAEALARKALELGVDPLEAINRGFTPGINRVGELFASGEYFLPDLVIGGEAMKAAVAVLEPELARRQEERKVLGKVIIGTVEGDIHEIGKTLVATMLNQRKVIEALQKAGLRDQVKVMVGGAPVTRQWAEEIGADGYAEDAVGSVALAKKLVGAG